MSPRRSSRVLEKTTALSATATAAGSAADPLATTSAATTTGDEASELTELEYETEGASPAISSLRRPQTTDPTKFYYISEDNWNKLVKESKIEHKQKVARNSLRKFDAAGRIMETDEGMDVPSPCPCTKSKSGHKEPCRVWRHRKQSGCAHCKRYGKSGCRARSMGKSKGKEAAEKEEDLAASQQRLDVLEEQLKEVKVELAKQKAVNETVHTSYNILQKDVARLWEKNFPASAVSSAAPPDKYAGSKYPRPWQSYQ